MYKEYGRIAINCRNRIGVPDLSVMRPEEVDFGTLFFEEIPTWESSERRRGRQKSLRMSRNCELNGGNEEEWMK